MRRFLLIGLMLSLVGCGRTNPPPNGPLLTAIAKPRSTSTPTIAPPTALPSTVLPATDLPLVIPTSAPTVEAQQPVQVPDLPPPSFDNCQADPNAQAAPNYPVNIVDVDKSGEEVLLENLSDTAITLDGWTMCSIEGNQQVPISGTLAPGERRTFPSADGAIWNNSETDDGALYNAQGQLVSYWFDR